MKIVRCVLLIFAAFVSATANADSAFLKGLEKGGLPRPKVPHIKEVVLKSGIRCYLMEDHTLPTIKISVMAKVGSIYEPSGKIGLARLTASALRSGGAGELSPEDFDFEIDRIGANISAGMGHEVGTASLSVMTEDLERGASLLMDMLFRPRFDEGRLNTARMKIAEDLRRERDDPDEYASILFGQFVYGEANPWARRPTGETLSSISSDDVKKFHEKYYKADNMLLSAAGDFETEKLIELLDGLTKDAPRGAVEFLEVEAVEPDFSPARKDVSGAMSQSFIRMGHLGVRRHNPDWFAISILSKILGASDFKSRLMDDIRVQKGLAYRITGQITQGTDYGLFAVRLSTGVANEDLAIESVKGHVRRVSENGDVTDDELRFAKRSMLSAAIFDIDSPFKIVNDRAIFEFYGYPADYWSVAYDGLSRVTREDVNGAAKKYLHPDGLKVLVLGPK